MKFNLKTTVILTSIVLVICVSSVSAHTDVTVGQAQNLIASMENLIVVDVREPSEYCDDDGHIDGAANYPLSSGVFYSRYAELPANQPILVVCQSGGRSNVAASFLDFKSFTEVYDMMGGMSSWTGDTVPCKYGGGSGIEIDPYQIWTAEQMNEIGLNEEDWDRHFILMDDIDLSQYTGEQFNMIGRFYGWGDPQNKPFIGVFDGNNHRIMNFTYQNYYSKGIGLFAFVDYLWDVPERVGVIRNLGLENVYVNARDSSCVGSLVGFCRGLVENCYARGRVKGFLYVGGLVGEHEGAWIRDSYFQGKVTGGDYVGGLIGFGECEITRCFSAGSVHGTNYVGGLAGDYDEDYMQMSFSSSSVYGVSWVGGLAGFVGDEGSIWDCYATGDVTGTEYVGGLAGFADKYGDDDEYAEITRSYATGKVTGSIRTNGFVGYNRGRINDSYWDVETSGIGEPGPGTGLPTWQLQHQATFVNWDFVNVWNIDENQTYPYLRIYGGAGFALEGAGTQKDPWLIQSPADFDVFVDNNFYWSGYTRLETDIDLGGKVYDRAVIAPDVNDLSGFQGPAFGGVFDGAGHKILNLTIDTGGADHDYLGLFGRIEGPSSEVKNVGIENSSITGGDETHVSGGLFGYSLDVTITNCYVTGTVDVGDNCGMLGGFCGKSGDGAVIDCYSTSTVSAGDNCEFIGGLCGYNSDSFMRGCYATGAVSGGAGSSDIGGLCGDNEDDTITGCYATGSVTGGPGSHSVGGLCGGNYGEIDNSYSTGTVIGISRVGGLCGYNANTDPITNCYSTGSVTGEEDSGGLCGFNMGTITNCFWDSNTGGPDNGLGTPLLTAQMQTLSIFLDADWDFINIWGIGENQTYPYLRKYSAADINKDKAVNMLDLSIMAEQWLQP